MRGRSRVQVLLRLKANCLYLYSRVPRHMAINCPYRPKHQASQVNASTNFDLDSPIATGNPSSPTPSNKFDVLSQLDEVLNK